MFNLLMFNVDWPSGRVKVPAARMFEYTEGHVTEQFNNGNEPLLDRLVALPCLFCVEGVAEETAYVGQINRARISGKEVSLEISFDSDIPPLQNRMIYANRTELDMPEEFEFSRNHWAVKDVNLYRFLLRNVRPRRQRPLVFQIPEHENIEPTLVSAMMPFDAGFSDVYAAIREATEKVGLKCRRADDIWENAAIIQDVVSLIDRSRIIVCDCTGRNPNVFYEAGIAHTLGREVILITQSEQDIPFDLRHLRYVRYLNNGEGRQALVTALQNRMQTILGH
ncbi:MAG: hypothetical protein JNM39_00155 [Bdellovibrionaceae bacterium]|nr:hypothetical protein [Pseudobdellovibrionaceae bacterium]